MHSRGSHHNPPSVGPFGGRGGGRGTPRPVHKMTLPQMLAETAVARSLLIAASRSPREDKKPTIILVLVGLPGSGKSTFSNFVANTTPHGRWGICCQDNLGDRKNSQQTADPPPFSQWRGCIIDRCNFDPSQRAHWIELAAESGSLGRPVLPLCVVMDRADDVAHCVNRATQRGADGVHAGNEDWGRIAHGMNASFSYPEPQEGFAATYYCSTVGGIGELVSLIAQLQ
eukprot:GSChrysophyteH2.ASY1.ANO1.126.1 assembled CDS